MDVKEFPGWIEDQRVKCLNIICEASSLHVCMPFHENEGETSRVLLQKYRDGWTRPYMRPKWLKVDPHRAHISEEFISGIERDDTLIVDTAGLAKEQNGKVERHGQLFEDRLLAVLAEVQPQCEGEWLECVAQVQEAKNSLLSVGGVSPHQIVFGKNRTFQVILHKMIQVSWATVLS